MKEEKKQRVRYLQKWKIRYFLPKLTIPSCVHSLMQHQLSREGGEDGWAPSLKGWHPSAPQMTGEHLGQTEPEQQQKRTGKIRPSQAGS